jgi:glycerol uptake facilitator-like aquaporin
MSVICYKKLWWIGITLIFSQGYPDKTADSSKTSKAEMHNQLRFAAEVLLTFVFILTIHGATSKKAPEGMAGIAIGLSLVLVHVVGIPITGTSVNPARSLGPALIVGLANTTALVQLWLFWVAPIIGAILAAVVPKVLD